MKTIADVIRSSNIPVWLGLHILRQMESEVYDKSIKTLAVDGDIIAYRTAAVCEEHFEGACDSIIDTTLRDISTETGIPLMRIYLSGEGNFRYATAKTRPYKGNRATMVRPRFLNHCKEYMATKYNGILMHGYEADDGIATDMTVNGAVHVGIDKDLFQVPGQHYNYVNKTWREIGDEESILVLYRQILMGDNSDNIPGLPKVGEKTAEKYIQNFATAMDDAKAAYLTICGEKMPEVDPNEYFTEQMHLIYMVRDVEIDYNKIAYVEPNSEGFEKQEGDFTDVDTSSPVGGARRPDISL